MLQGKNAENDAMPGVCESLIPDVVDAQSTSEQSQLCKLSGTYLRSHYAKISMVGSYTENLEILEGERLCKCGRLPGTISLRKKIGSFNH